MKLGNPNREALAVQGWDFQSRKLPGILLLTHMNLQIILMRIILHHFTCTMTEDELIKIFFITAEEAATTVPPETRHPLDEPHGCTLNGKYYKDGEALASSNPCEHCYCMRNEIVCAVQRCKAPCSGCIPIKSDKDKCCPERYECCNYMILSFAHFHSWHFDNSYLFSSHFHKIGKILNS